LLTPPTTEKSREVRKGIKGCHGGWEKENRPLAKGMKMCGGKVRIHNELRWLEKGVVVNL